ncbi:CLUMA_CG011512, isoform A [Clunio marinus]|uniref:CLUMA_CG011512, isoform A n=1 Tax=Clunio marinus TaxID=568069 RepID=A0A1J1ID28_9DIPT|nr:CLUMA_CG011512, isoform A [Clunio marinus]
MSVSQSIELNGTFAHLCCEQVRILLNSYCSPQAQIAPDIILRLRNIEVGHLAFKTKDSTMARGRRIDVCLTYKEMIAFMKRITNESGTSEWVLCSSKKQFEGKKIMAISQLEA